MKAYACLIDGLTFLKNQNYQVKNSTLELKWSNFMDFDVVGDVVLIVLVKMLLFSL